MGQTVWLVQVESSCLVAGVVTVLMDFKGMENVFVTQDTVVWLVKDATHPSVQHPQWIAMRTMVVVMCLLSAHKQL